jgi:hypothetical protein
MSGRNLCNCPNCQTDDCPAGKVLEDLESVIHNMIISHGQFISDLTFAAFGHRDALTYEQILAGITSMRKGIETTLANQIKLTRKVIGGES